MSGGDVVERPCHACGEMSGHLEGCAAAPALPEGDE